MRRSGAARAHGSYQPGLGQSGPGRGIARAALFVLVTAVAASACGKPASHITAPTPVFSFNPPPTAQPSVTVTATASPTPTPSPVVRPTPSPTHPASPKPSVKPSGTPSTTPTVQVSEASGSTKTITLGTVMTLTLVQDANTTWTFTTSANPSILSLIGDQTLAPLATEPAGSNRRRFTFKAVGVGSTGFALNEEPVGSPTAPAITTYALNVIVTQ